MCVWADPPSKVRGSISVIFGSQISLTDSLLQERWRERSTSQHSYDKIMDNNMALFHEWCFPKCTRSWRIKLFPYFGEGDRPCVNVCGRFCSLCFIYMCMQCKITFLISYILPVQWILFSDHFKELMTKFTTIFKKHFKVRFMKIDPMSVGTSNKQHQKFFEVQQKEQ